MLEVLPVVKSWALKHGILFDFIDLRWGITLEQSIDLHHTIKICLQRVRDTDPIFINLLGDRYGWVPLEEDFNQSMFPKDIAPYRHLSATELEIHQALTNAFYDCPKKEKIFLVRKINNYEDLQNDKLISWFNDDPESKQQALRKYLLEQEGALLYTTSFNKDKPCSWHVRSEYIPSFAMDDFKLDGKDLKDALIERIISLLKKKYDIDENDIIDAMEPLSRQAYHLESLLNSYEVPLIGNQMEEAFDSLKLGERHCFMMRHHNGLSTQAAHFIDKKLKEGEYHIFYRFMGIDAYSRTAHDILRSLAYELGLEDAFHRELDEVMVYVKREFEILGLKEHEKIAILIDGVPKEELSEIIHLVQGLYCHKSMVFMAAPDEYVKVKYDDASLRELMVYLLFKKGKTIEKAEIEKVLNYVQGDFSLLHIIVNYLIKFSLFETVSSSIDTMIQMDKAHLYRFYFHEIIEGYKARSSMPNLLERLLSLLAFSPYPLSLDALFGAMNNLYKDIDEKKELNKHIQFALNYAREIVEEFNGCYAISNQDIKDALLHEPYVLAGSDTAFIALSLYYQQIYLSGRMDLLSDDDLSLMLLTIPEVLSPKTQKDAALTVLSNFEDFYRLIMRIGKRKASELFLYADCNVRGIRSPAKIIKTKETEGLQEAFDRTNKYVFSTSKKLKPSLLSAAYDALVSLEDHPFPSRDAFADHIKSHLVRVEEHHPYTDLLLETFLGDANIIPLKSYTEARFPANIKATANNTCLYEFSLYVVDHDTLFILDPATMEIQKLYPIHVVDTKIMGVYAFSKQLYILTNIGTVVVFNTVETTSKVFRYIEPGLKVNKVIPYDRHHHIILTSDNEVRITKDFSNTLLSWRMMDDEEVEDATLVIDNNRINGAFFITYRFDQKCHTLIHFDFSKPGELNIGNAWNMAKCQYLGPRIARIGNDFYITFIALEHHAQQQYIARYQNGVYELEYNPGRKLLASLRGGILETDGSSLYYDNKSICPFSDDMLEAYSTLTIIGVLTEANTFISEEISTTKIGE